MITPYKKKIIQSAVKPKQIICEIDSRQRAFPVIVKRDISIKNQLVPKKHIPFCIKNT